MPCITTVAPWQTVALREGPDAPADLQYTFHFSGASRTWPRSTATRGARWSKGNDILMGVPIPPDLSGSRSAAHGVNVAA